MPCENWDQRYRYSSYPNLYLLCFDYYSQEFLGIRASGALDVLNENFKHLTLPLCQQNSTVVSEPILIYVIKSLNYYLDCDQA